MKSVNQQITNKVSTDVLPSLYVSRLEFRINQISINLIPLLDVKNSIQNTSYSTLARHKYGHKVHICPMNIRIFGIL